MRGRRLNKRILTETTLNVSPPLPASSSILGEFTLGERADLSDLGL